MTGPRRLLTDGSVRALVRDDLEALSRATTGYDTELGVSSLIKRLAALDAQPRVPESADIPSAMPRLMRMSSTGSIKTALAVLGCAVTGMTSYHLLSSRVQSPAPVPAHVAITPERTTAPPVTPPPTLEPLQRQPVQDPHAVRSLRSRAHVSASRREIEQLVQIQASLERDPASAYRLAQASAREFPSGPLREEREGLSVIALYMLGETERAQQEAARFSARYPNSPMRNRIARLAER